MMSATYLTDKAWGHGLATIAQDGTVLDAWFPDPVVGEAPKSDLQWFSPRELDGLVGIDELRNVRTEVIRVEIELSNPVISLVYINFNPVTEKCKPPIAPGCPAAIEVVITPELSIT